jgi:hypothetical protein
MVLSNPFISGYKDRFLNSQFNIFFERINLLADLAQIISVKPSVSQMNTLILFA